MDKKQTWLQKYSPELIALAIVLIVGFLIAYAFISAIPQGSAPTGGCCVTDFNVTDCGTCCSGTCITSWWPIYALVIVACFIIALIIALWLRFAKNGGKLG